MWTDDTVDVFQGQQSSDSYVAATIARNRRRRIFSIFSVFYVGAIITLCFMVSSLRSRRAGGKEATAECAGKSPQESPSEWCTTRPQEIVAASVLGHYVCPCLDATSTCCSSEEKALQWMISDDGYTYNASDSSSADIFAKERFTMATFLFSTGRDDLLKDEMFAGTDHCSWQGITCKDAKGIPIKSNGTITKIFYLESLKGYIPSVIGELRNLEVLHLSVDELTGTIPTEIGQLLQLTNLHMRDNSLSGTLPTEIGNMEKMISLDIGINRLKGKIPTELGKMKNLVDLDLFDNAFTGQIPSELGSIESLYSLELNNNKLVGKVPPELGDLHELYWLKLEGNQLTGEIPPAVCDLRQNENDELYHLSAMCRVCPKGVTGNNECCTSCE